VVFVAVAGDTVLDDVFCPVTNLVLFGRNLSCDGLLLEKWFTFDVALVQFELT